MSAPKATLLVRSGSVSALHRMNIEEWETLARRAKFKPAKLAELCHCSLRTLERFFLTHFAKTPLRWARELRSRLAKDFLSQGCINKEVVAELGFASEAHLCHEFHNFLGATPKSFALRPVELSPIPTPDSRRGLAEFSEGLSSKPFLVPEDVAKKQ
jgi:AraC-like DNA-binding protein